MDGVGISQSVRDRFGREDGITFFNPAVKIPRTALIFSRWLTRCTSSNRTDMNVVVVVFFYLVWYIVYSGVFHSFRAQTD